MNRTLEDLASDETFVESTFSLGLSECFSEETRKSRNLLLALSSVAALSATGIVRFGEEVKGPIGTTLKVGPELKYVIGILTVFFLVLFVSRSYSEWKLWRLKNAKPEKALADANNLVTTEVAQRTIAYEAAAQRRHHLRQTIPTLASKRQEHSIQESAAEAELDAARGAKDFAVTLHDRIWTHFKPLRTTRRIRLWWEAAFPVAFALGCLAYAVSRWNA